MPRLSKDAREQRESSEAGLATLGRQIADERMGGRTASGLMNDAAIRRASELAQIDREIQLAGIVRQIGDAVNSGRPVDALLYRLIELRRHELR